MSYRGLKSLKSVTYTRTNTHTSGRQLKIIFIGVLEYYEYSDTNIANFFFPRKHSFISEEAKVMKVRTLSIIYKAYDRMWLTANSKLFITRPNKLWMRSKNIAICTSSTLGLSMTSTEAFELNKLTPSLSLISSSKFSLCLHLRKIERAKEKNYLCQLDASHCELVITYRQDLSGTRGSGIVETGVMTFLDITTFRARLIPWNKNKVLTFVVFVLFFFL